jgi:tripartite-type tricarboxylate transporter receptor subunit TctC
MCKKKGLFLTISLLSIISVLLLNALAEQVQAQEKYPNRAIDIIVSWTAGGGADLCARFGAEYLKKKWDVPVNVVNKPGGMTVPGCLEVYQATPDGYTILADGQGESSLQTIAVKNLPFEVLNRTFICITTACPSLFAVPATYPWKTLKDIEEEIKRDPENFTWTSLGSVGPGDFVLRQFFRSIGVDISKTKPIICHGTSEAVALTAGGHTKMAVVSTAAAYSAAKAGKIRPVGITGFSRLQSYPDVPTAVEQGYPKVTVVSWKGFSGPPKLPNQIVDKWNQAMEEFVKDPETISKIEKMGCTPFYRNSSEMREYVEEEIENARQSWGMK